MATLKEIRVPDMGNFDAVEVIEVPVREGTTVKTDDTLITLESDKATMDIPSPDAGKIATLNVKVGDRIAEGCLILTLEAAETVEPSTPETPAPAPAPAPVSVPANIPPAVLPEGSHKAHASPSVRRFARELGVDLSLVNGSGPKRRILKDDVQAYVKTEITKPQSTSGSLAINLADMPVVDFTKFGAIEIRPLAKIKRISGANLHRNWISAPHVTQFDETDITELEAFRKSLGAEAKQRNTKLTLLPFLVKAVVAMLRTDPTFNASLAPDGENLIVKQYYHVGFAVDTPDGLVVPVIRDANRKSVWEIAAEMSTLSAKARDKKLSPAEMQGGTFTISSLGGVGGTYFTPIINLPEVAILGISRATIRPFYQDTQFVPRLMLPLSLSYDHRVIDGAQGVRFTTALCKLLSDVRRLLL